MMGSFLTPWRAWALDSACLPACLRSRPSSTTDCCVTLSKFLYLSVFRFPHLQHGHNYEICFRIKLNEWIHNKHSEKFLAHITCIINVTGSNYIFMVVPPHVITRPNPVDHAVHRATPKKRKKKKINHPALPLSSTLFQVCWNQPTNIQAVFLLF